MAFAVTSICFGPADVIWIIQSEAERLCCRQLPRECYRDDNGYETGLEDGVWSAKWASVISLSLSLPPIVETWSYTFKHLTSSTTTKIDFSVTKRFKFVVVTGISSLLSFYYCKYRNNKTKSYHSCVSNTCLLGTRKSNFSSLSILLRELQEISLVVRT